MHIDWQVKLEEAVLQGDHAAMRNALANGADPALPVMSETTRDLLSPSMPEDVSLLARVIVMHEVPSCYPKDKPHLQSDSWSLVQSLLIDAVAPGCTDGFPEIMAQNFDSTTWGLQGKLDANTVFDLIEHTVYLFQITPGTMKVELAMRHLMQSLPKTPPVCDALEALALRMMEKALASHTKSLAKPSFRVAIQALLALPKYSKDLVTRLENYQVQGDNDKPMPLLHVVAGGGLSIKYIPGIDKLLEKLLDQGCNPNLRDLKTGNTLFMAAADEVNPDAIATLLKAGADTRLKNYRGWSMHSFLGARRINPASSTCRALLAAHDARNILQSMAQLPSGADQRSQP